MDNYVKPKILVIVGPTASGKTALSIALAKKLGGEIVSADSRQIYREMDIGTAKPLRGKFKIQNSKFRKNTYFSEGIPHHLIDIKNPNEDYTVAEYKCDAVKVVREILKRGKFPILVGGTGLYVKAVVDNLDIPHVAANETLRRKLEEEVKNKGTEYIFKKLVALDPEAAYIVDPKNPRRVIRALEVTLVTGRPFTAQRKKSAPLFNAKIIGIETPLATLRHRIDTRVDIMMQNGLLKEVQGLYRKYDSVKALDAIGYREIIEYFKKKISLDEAVRQMKLNTWRYARRQMTWFRKDKNIQWRKK
ncbi:MAG: tRNA (adenosine(37)-N6)-dimethylallyltransferase MiaA [Patescibacteria group bacterium]|nr:tRNA (adenosine(37)-N6)-dimethylallyltransferase MiaA [Patescibacteria group bacterium]